MIVPKQDTFCGTNGADGLVLVPCLRKLCCIFLAVTARHCCLFVNALNHVFSSISARSIPSNPDFVLCYRNLDVTMLCRAQVRAGVDRDKEGREARRPRVADRVRVGLQVQQRRLARVAARAHSARGLAGLIHPAA